MLCIVLEFKLTYLHHHHQHMQNMTIPYIKKNINKTAFAYSYTVATHYCPEMCALPALHFTHVELFCLFHYTVYVNTTPEIQRNIFTQNVVHQTQLRPTVRQPQLCVVCSNAHFIDVQRQHEHSVISIILMWRHDAACVCVLLCFPTATNPKTICTILS